MTYKSLLHILEAEYGVGALVASPEVVLWAAEKLPKEQAISELSALNRAREKYGTMPVCAPYGHPLFE